MLNCIKVESENQMHAHIPRALSTNHRNIKELENTLLHCHQESWSGLNYRQNV